MSTQRYSVTPQPVETLLTWVKTGEIANFVLAQSEINIAIGDKAPEKYFADLGEQCRSGKVKFGGITDEAEMRANFRANSLPESLLDGEIPDYDAFLETRRHLMAAKLQTWFESF